ncbi:MAG TPA: DUF4035 domain-containing protein [Tepidisphaeraceae bacterium]|nr:DUF4035 domain-containing protein [Tepidisphaeraceae bacterium]
MTTVEFQRWQEFNELEPFTEDRADLRAAMVCSTLAQLHGMKVKPSDFMPEFGEKAAPEPMTDEAMRDQALKLTAMMQGRITKQGT